eukprot:gene6824-30797_t
MLPRALASFNMPRNPNLRALLCALLCFLISVNAEVEVSSSSSNREKFVLDGVAWRSYRDTNRDTQYYVNQDTMKPQWDDPRKDVAAAPGNGEDGAKYDSLHSHKLIESFELKGEKWAAYLHSGSNPPRVFFNNLGTHKSQYYDPRKGSPEVDLTPLVPCFFSQLRNSQHYDPRKVVSEDGGSVLTIIALPFMLVFIAGAAYALFLIKTKPELFKPPKKVHRTRYGTIILSAKEKAEKAEQEARKKSGKAE